MHLETLEPGHVVWRSRRRGAAAVLAVGVLGAALAWSSTGGVGPPAGWIAFGLSLALALGAAIALTCRTTIELSPPGLRVLRQRFASFDERAAPRAALQAVRVRGEIVVSHGEHGTQQSMRYHVELQLDGCRELPAAVPLWRGSSEVRARAFAERSARAANAPFADAVGDEVVLRAADRLDRRPETRRPFPVAYGPDAPPPGVTVDDDGAVDMRGLVPPDRRRLLRLLPLLLVPLCAASVAVTVLVVPARALALLLPAVLGIELFALGLLVFVANCRTRITVEEGRLRCTHGLFGAALRTLQVESDRVEQVRVQTGASQAPVLERGVAVVTDAQVLVVGRGLDAGACGWLAAWLEERLWPDLPVRDDGPAPIARSRASTASTVASRVEVPAVSPMQR